MSFKPKLYYKSFFQLIYIILIAVLTSPFSAHAIQSKLENGNTETDHVFKKTIKTVLLHKIGFEMSEPIIQLHSNEKLLLSFDDLDDAKVKNYKYTIQHYNASWNKSDLLNSQYIEGYYEDYIENYEFSINTTIPYIHYSLEFPNENIRLTKSGNYVITVYEEDESKIVLKKRFKIIEPLINIEASVKTAERISERDLKQEIGFTIFKNKLYLQNPERDLKITIQQNGRKDNIVGDLAPVRYHGDELDYHFNQKAIFDGGNEFRSFDTKTLRYRTEYVKNIEYREGVHHVQLWEEEVKAKDVYHNEYDINGEFFIQNSDGEDPNIEADYHWVYFKIAHKFIPTKNKLYFVGKLSNWEFNPENELKYNFEKQCYEAKTFVKQGYYNYQLIFYDIENNYTDLSKFEGNHFETTNDYTISVYYLEPGTYYEQLIGYLKFRAHN